VRVLIVGAGGREHALAWKLSQDSARPQLFAAPGNAGTAAVAENLPISPTDVTGLIDFAERSGIDLTVVGPEAPLAAGVVDAFKARGLRIFGPTRAAARLETSKVFAKELMRRRGIPTAAFEVFYSPLAAIEYVQRQRRSLVVKADGLAAGKGVVVAQTPDEAQRAIEDMLIRGTLGDAGRRIVIEERLEGSEASLLVLVGPGGVSPLLPARDYKRLSDGDRGPNTGGMGAIAPVDLVPGTDSAGIPYQVPVKGILDSIVEPVIAAMQRDGSPYTGVLYVGLMLTAEGPKVLELNCRFGDPEAQVILPLLESDLATALIDVLDGRDPQLQWRDEFAACVVLASGGYPGPYRTGLPIRGLDAIPDDVLVFHAGTRPDGDPIVTSGGRVLNLVGRGPSLAAALERAYAGVSTVGFDGMHFRTDVGRDNAKMLSEVPG
jgi:phosphoribosylamine--glycine ligase